MHHLIPIQSVLFDLDGTLVDTAEDFIYAATQLCQKYNKPLVAPEHIRREISCGVQHLACFVLNTDPKIDKEEKNNFGEELKLYYAQRISTKNRTPSVCLYPHIESLLQQLEAKKIPWGVVTNKKFVFADIILQTLNLSSRSSITICPDHVQHPKPSAEALLLACKKINRDPKHSIYIGDHHRDIIAGKSANMFTIAAGYGYIQPEVKLQDWQANVIVNEAKEIELWLEQQQWCLPAGFDV